MSSLPEVRAPRAAYVRIVSIARALMRIPDYDAYLAHHAAYHPEATPLGRADFFAERQSARFGAGATRCC